MCGRYAVTLDANALARELDAELASRELPTSANLAPTMPAPILVAREGRKLGPASFGLVLASRTQEHGARRFINARAETLTTTNAFRDAALHRRCLVPAEGFYEWKVGPGGKQPYYVHAADRSLLTFAGVYAVDRHAPPGPSRTSFAIVTRPALGVAAELHDRMPLIVPPELREGWLRPTDADARTLVEALISAPPVALRAHPVSKNVNDPRFDDPAVREPLEDER